MVAQLAQSAVVCGASQVPPEEPDEDVLDVELPELVLVLLVLVPLLVLVLLVLVPLLVLVLLVEVPLDVEVEEELPPQSKGQVLESSFASQVLSPQKLPLLGRTLLLEQAAKTPTETNIAAKAQDFMINPPETVCFAQRPPIERR